MKASIAQLAVIASDCLSARSMRPELSSARDLSDVTRDRSQSDHEEKTS
jgi:hypothetical protein